MNQTMSLTVTKSTNQREVEMMFGKAMCAYANWQTSLDNPYSKDSQIAYKNEYEATARCIDMFVEEHLQQVCGAVIDAAKEEFGI